MEKKRNPCLQPRCGTRKEGKCEDVISLLLQPSKPIWNMECRPLPIVIIVTTMATCVPIITHTHTSRIFEHICPRKENFPTLQNYRHQHDYCIWKTAQTAIALKKRYRNWERKCYLW